MIRSRQSGRITIYIFLFKAHYKPVRSSLNRRCKNRTTRQNDQETDKVLQSRQGKINKKKKLKRNLPVGSGTRPNEKGAFGRLSGLTNDGGFNF